MGSVFFEPALPFNIVGAQRLGIIKALDLDNDNFTRLVTAVGNRTPGLALLWHGAIIVEAARLKIHELRFPMPPVNFAVGLWTGLSTSFLQTQGMSSVQSERTIPRATACATSFFTQRRVRKPIYQTPPFIEALRSNTILEVRAHLNHSHGMRHVKFFWTVNIGEGTEACRPVSWQRPQLMLWEAPICNGLVESELVGQQIHRQQCSRMGNDRWDDALDVSCTATSNIFERYRHNDDGGLWLDDGIRNGFGGCAGISSSSLACDRKRSRGKVIRQIFTKYKGCS